MKNYRSFSSMYDFYGYHPFIKELYGHSGFMNYGYWDNNVEGFDEASKNLIDKIISMIQVKRGKVLDVACGQGATTRRISEYFKEENIYAINISKKQLESGKQKVPKANFLFMDATDLDFQNDFFDCIICVEAAFHFDTREDFLKEAYRVLKPGGSIVLSDFLFTSRLLLSKSRFPKKNILGSRDEYRDILERIGYRDITISNVTDKSSTVYTNKLCTYTLYRILKGNIRNKFRHLWYFSSIILPLFVILRGSIKEYLLINSSK